MMKKRSFPAISLKIGALLSPPFMKRSYFSAVAAMIMTGF